MSDNKFELLPIPPKNTERSLSTRVTIPLSEAEVTIIGRKNLLESCFISCGCTNISKSSNAKEFRNNLCSDCKDLEQWGIKYISKCMLKIYPIHSNNNGTYEWRLERCGLNASNLVSIAHLKDDKYPEKKIGPDEENDLLFVGDEIHIGDFCGHKSWIKPNQTQEAKTKLKFRIINDLTKPVPNTVALGQYVCTDTTNEEKVKFASIEKKSEISDSTLNENKQLSQNCIEIKELKESNPNKSDDIDLDQMKCVFLIPLGRKMSYSRINILKDILKRKGIKTVDDYRENTSYWVIDENVSIQSVASKLGFVSSQKMAEFVIKNNIYLVKPIWIHQLNDDLNENVFEHCWSGIQELKSMVSKQKLKKSLCETTRKQENWSENETYRHDFTGYLTRAPLIKFDDGLAPRPLKKPKVEGDMKREMSSISSCPQTRNIFLSKMMEELAKITRESALSDIDEWRSYSYMKAAGRLKRLDFEVINHPDVWEKVERIKGIGKSIGSKLKEYLQTGKCQKLLHMRNDPERVAVRNMTKIWGIGHKKSIELVNLGYKNIAEVRHGLASRSLQLYGNALIGVDCYEDFEEKMTREEVEKISDIVIDACHEMLPQAEVEIMGSYRRGAKSCGDVDVLIVHKNFFVNTPLNAVDELVERLRVRGFIVHHLTSVKSPSWTKDETPNNFNMISDSKTSGGKGIFITNNVHTNAFSYMGVFLSPTSNGKRRRIDIKFYPYRERAFATLYFTGNGFFNRSMRLYATRIMKMTLNDHGLFPLNKHGKKPLSGKSEYCHTNSLSANTERDIFDLLNLKYREPNQRNCFDDVIVKDNNLSTLLMDYKLENHEMKEERNHQFIN